MSIGYNCYRKWQPNYACQIVNAPGEFPTHQECVNYCQPQQVPGYDIVAMEKSCNGRYISEHRANNPQQCAEYCNKDFFGNCRYFMWDSTKEERNPEFITDSNCILFTDIPYNCTEIINTYPASLGSVLYGISSSGL